MLRRWIWTATGKLPSLAFALHSLALMMLGLTPAPDVSAQTPAPQQPTFRAQTTLVEVSAVVIDGDGKPIVDLAPDDIAIFDDGAPVRLVNFRRLETGTTVKTPRVDVPGRPEVVKSNVDVQNGPVFVLLLDDLNTSPYNSHRAISGGLGILEALPQDALVAVLFTSGIDGTALVLSPRAHEHSERVKAFRGQLLLAGPAPQAAVDPRMNPRVSVGMPTRPSSVGAPCGVGSAVAQSQDCADPARAERRARVVQAVADALRGTGSRRKVLFWLTEDMGVSPIAPEGSGQAQRDALRAVLDADVAVYPIHPIGNRPQTGSQRLPDRPDTYDSDTDERPLDGRPDQRTGVTIRVGKDAGETSRMKLATDDLVTVTLDEMARESGGQWIRQIDQLDAVLAQIVRQNSTAYLLAYESPNVHVPGPHRIGVRVRRSGARVYARRAYIVPEHRNDGPTHDIVEPSASAALTELLERVVPGGTLAMRLRATPFLTDGKDGRILVTAQVNENAVLNQDVDLALVTFDEAGTAVNQQLLRLTRPSQNGFWEVTVEFRLRKGTYYVHAAAATLDGSQTGVVLDRVEIQKAGNDLWMSAPVLLSSAPMMEVTSLHPTLQRTFNPGQPLVAQMELVGRTVAERKATVSAHLVDATGADVRQGATAIEPTARKERVRASVVLRTEGLSPGPYALVVEARTPGRDDMVRYVISLLLQTR